MNSEDFFEKERMKDAYQWAEDVTKRLREKAKENPNGWHAKILRAYEGDFPVVGIKRPVVVSCFEKTVDVQKVEEETLKILERW